MLVFSLYALLLFQVQYAVSDLLPWPLQSDTGCYGNTAEDYLHPICNLTSPSVMVVSRVYGMAKKNSTGCPHPSTAGNRDEEKCCTVAEEDCKMNYTSDLVFYTTCTGHPNCDMNVAWMPTTCNKSDYLQRSNYMLMEYYCIATSLILNASDTEDDTTSGRAVYLQNEGYPGSSVIGGSCSVSASCRTSVTITVIHLKLNDAGNCSQYIHVRDGDSNHTIDCTNNNDDDYVIRDVYNSVSHFLILSFINENNADEGQMWIQIMGSNNNSTMDLRCGSLAVSDPPDVDQCPEFLDASTSTPVTTSVSTPTGQSTTHVTPDVTNVLPSTGTTEDGSLIGIIAGIIAAVLVVALIIVFVCWWKKQKEKNKVGDKEKLQDGADGNEYGIGEDGLPVYTYGTKPNMIISHLPKQTLLNSSSGDITGEDKPKQARVMSALKTFDQVQRTPSSLAGPLPQVRGPPRPMPQDLINDFGVHPLAPMVNQDGMGMGVQANGRAVLGGEETHSKPHKKKKKHKSAADEHGEKKKKKKKKKKKEKQEDDEE